ncbi:hypothetical protein RI129_009707 [Pyrocoelia pectoralis]|uniref:Uncharacterized protein n=1 Tax=Pyrocoelia pectoralis TaxID=417401 RepID=A0AAN7V2P5_9COLE
MTVIIVFILQLCISLTFQDSLDINSVPVHIDEDFYWRDYRGSIPKDALVGGSKLNRPTYIGQVVHSNSLIPGPIVQEDKGMYFYFEGDAYFVTENVKIFCTKHPEKFNWTKIHNGEVRNGLDVNRFVIGGSNNMYIGRIRYHDGDLVGRFSLDSSSYSTLISFEGSVDDMLVEGNTFEILYYIDDGRKRQFVSFSLKKTFNSFLIVANSLITLWFSKFLQ